jgi:hypothetical protein
MFLVIRQDSATFVVRVIEGNHNRMAHHDSNDPSLRLLEARETVAATADTIGGRAAVGHVDQPMGRQITPALRRDLGRAVPALPPWLAAECPIRFPRWTLRSFPRFLREVASRTGAMPPPIGREQVGQPGVAPHEHNLLSASGASQFRRLQRASTTASKSRSSADTTRSNDKTTARSLLLLLEQFWMEHLIRSA